MVDTLRSGKRRPLGLVGGVCLASPLMLPLCTLLVVAPAESPEVVGPAGARRGGLNRPSPSAGPGLRLKFELADDRGLSTIVTPSTPARTLSDMEPGTKLLRCNQGNWISGIVFVLGFGEHERFSQPRAAGVQVHGVLRVLGLQALVLHLNTLGRLLFLLLLTL
jgi:hypothetical protein